MYALCESVYLTRFVHLCVLKCFRQFCIPPVGGLFHTRLFCLLVYACDRGLMYVKRDKLVPDSAMFYVTN